MALTYTLQEAMEQQRETEALRAGVPQHDLSLSRQCGLDPMDVYTFRKFSGQGYLIVVRCPKISARAWHGRIPPKPIAIKDKSGDSEVAVREAGRSDVRVRL